MTVGLPGVTIAVCAVRGGHGWRLPPKDITAAEAMTRLRRTSILTILFSVAFVARAIGLTAYGGPFEHGHVAIFGAITIVACIFCLTHLPVAPLLGTFIVTGVFLFHCFTSGNSVFIAIALNTAFCAVVMVRILINILPGPPPVDRLQGGGAAPGRGEPVPGAHRQPDRAAQPPLLLPAPGCAARRLGRRSSVL